MDTYTDTHTHTYITEAAQTNSVFVVPAAQQNKEAALARLNKDLKAVHASLTGTFEVAADDGNLLLLRILGLKGNKKLSREPREEVGVIVDKHFHGASVYHQNGMCLC